MFQMLQLKNFFFQKKISLTDVDCNTSKIQCFKNFQNIQLQRFQNNSYHNIFINKIANLSVWKCSMNQRSNAIDYNSLEMFVHNNSKNLQGQSCETIFLLKLFFFFILFIEETFKFSIPLLPAVSILNVSNVSDTMPTGKYDLNEKKNLLFALNWKSYDFFSFPLSLPRKLWWWMMEIYLDRIFIDFHCDSAQKSYKVVDSLIISSILNFLLLFLKIAQKSNLIL